jgi:DNA-binding response OmpR family regulator
MLAIPCSFSKRWLLALSRSSCTLLGMVNKDSLCSLRRDFVPSLIILDLNMPRIGGFTFLQRYQPRDIPIVVFSVSPLEADKEFSLELGASEYVQKPIELEAFTDVVCQMVVNWVGQKDTAAVP